jgi:hypothetical protein
LRRILLSIKIFDENWCPIVKSRIQCPLLPLFTDILTFTSFSTFSKASEDQVLLSSLLRYVGIRIL